MKPRLLLVENHAIFAATVTAQFLTGYRVSNVSSVSSARRLLGENSFRVVLVDYDLDDGKGVDVVLAAKRLLPAAVIIAISAHEFGNEALRSAGATAVCRKTSFHEIANVLSHCLASTDYL